MDTKSKYFLEKTRIQIDAIIGDSDTPLKTPLQGGRLDKKHHIVLKKIKLEKIDTRIFHVNHDKLNRPLGLLYSKSENRKDDSSVEGGGGKESSNLSYSRSRSNLANKPLLGMTRSKTGFNLKNNHQKTRGGAKLVSNFCQIGSLKDYLMMEPISVLEAVALCLQIVQGMRYLEYQGIIHGRLSCRNVLIKEKNTGNLLLSDFGLDDIHFKNYPFNIPAAEMNYFCSNGLYSTKCIDIWAFGMTVLEIFNGGVKPYNMMNEFAILEKLKKGLRPARPEVCPPCVYELVLRCLLSDVENRPTFNNLAQAFDTIYLAMSMADFEWRDEIFGLEDSEDSEEVFAQTPENSRSSKKPEDIDSFKMKTIHPVYTTQQSVTLLTDPKTKSNILTTEQLNHLKEFTRPGCSKPYQARNDLVWIDLPDNRKNANHDHYGDTSSNKKSHYALMKIDEDEPNKTHGIISFFKHQAGLFDFNNELWNLLDNPNKLQSESTVLGQNINHFGKSNYSQYSNPLYPVTYDKDAGRFYTLHLGAIGINIKTFDIFDSGWRAEKTIIPQKLLNDTEIRFADLSAFDITYYKNQVYVLGGYDSEQNLVMKICLRYDCFTRTWSKCKPMPRPRMYHTTIAVDDEIYVIGGCTLSGQQNRENTANRYPCLKGILSVSHQPLMLARSLLQNKEVTAQNNKPREHRSIDRMNLKTQRWDTLESPNNDEYCFIPRRRHASCLVDNRIFVAGGINANGILTSVQVQDSFVDDETDEYIENGWIDLPNLEAERYDLGMDALQLSEDPEDWKIYAVGGIGPGGVASSVIEEFDLRSKNWSTITMISLSSMPVLSDGFSGSCRLFLCREQSGYDMIVNSGDNVGKIDEERLLENFDNDNQFRSYSSYK